MNRTRALPLAVVLLTMLAVAGAVLALSGGSAPPALSAEIDRMELEDEPQVSAEILKKVGSEDWQLALFVSGPRSMLNPNGKNAKVWRDWFGLRLPDNASAPRAPRPKRRK